MGSSIKVSSIKASSVNASSATEMSASGKIQRNKHSSSSLSENVTPAPVVTDILEQRYQSVSHNSRLPSLDARLAELHQLYPYREFAPDQVVDLMAQSTAWQSTTAVPDSLPLTEAQRNDGREFVDVNPDRLEVLLPGDNFELPLERLGMHLQMQVDSREALPNGGFTLHGRVLGGTDVMRVTITQNDGLSIAGIDTPQGHVVLQANDGQGWIASSETLFKQDPNRTDIVLPHDE
ncbi:MAG: hypothetical protein B0W54_17455 [Cellvibrio sp. 79]|nr:MAG: hypothetical protein B0W54_17455 [Cellvibrio sp. 79]